MKEKSKNEYVRRSQRNYSMSFKLQIVKEIESGELTIYAARRKYGIQGSNTVFQKPLKIGWRNRLCSFFSMIFHGYEF
jgi:transposase